MRTSGGKLGIILLGFLSLSITAESSQACSCIADPYSKKYLHMDHTWYGTYRQWTCDYKCYSNTQEETVVGTLSGHYMGDPRGDYGTEGICEGLVYEDTYNNFLSRFVAMLDHAENFDPRSAKTPELRHWGKLNCIEK